MSNAFPRQCSSVPSSLRESQLRSSAAKLYQVRRVQAKDYFICSLIINVPKPTNFFSSPRKICDETAEKYFYTKKCYERTRKFDLIYTYFSLFFIYTLFLVTTAALLCYFLLRRLLILILSGLIYFESNGEFALPKS